MKSTIPNEIWSLIKETQENLKEVSVSQKETNQQIQRFSKELSASQKETDQQIQRFSEELSASQKELQVSQKSCKPAKKRPINK